MKIFQLSSARVGEISSSIQAYAVAAAIYCFAAFKGHWPRLRRFCRVFCYTAAPETSFGTPVCFETVALTDRTSPLIGRSGVVEVYKESKNTTAPQQKFTPRLCDSFYQHVRLDRRQGHINLSEIEGHLDFNEKTLRKRPSRICNIENWKNTHFTKNVV